MLEYLKSDYPCFENTFKNNDLYYSSLIRSVSMVLNRIYIGNYINHVSKIIIHYEFTNLVLYI